MKDQKTLTCPQCGRRYAEPADRCSVDGSPLYGPEVLRRIGSRVNNYRIDSILGEGGMGVVYKGEQVMLQKPVAIKILHERFARREGAAEQFLREARAASRVRHQNIVDVTDFGETQDGSIYFVMEYLEGESVEDVLAREHHIEIFSAVNIVRQIAHALAAAHDQGIVHLDLKPENIFLISREGRRKIVRRVDQNGGSGKEFVVEQEKEYDFVKLLDFGVAKFTQDNLGPGLGTRAGMVFGTPHYMSPEQARGEKVDPRSDIYSLGVLFYEMILGEVPFEGDVALDVLNAHVSTPPVPPNKRNPQIHVDPGTNRTISRCLLKRPDERYQTMDELLEALLDCFTDRVFLRDAHKLPGAVESGIEPPKLPHRQALPGYSLDQAAGQAPPPGIQQPGIQPPGAQQASVATASAPPALGSATGPQVGRKQSLTEELAELFGKPPSNPDLAATPAPAPAPSAPGAAPAAPAPAAPESSLAQEARRNVVPPGAAQPAPQPAAPSPSGTRLATGEFGDEAHAGAGIMRPPAADPKKPPRRSTGPRDSVPRERRPTSLGVGSEPKPPVDEDNQEKPPKRARRATEPLTSKTRK
jgi:serine/threonine protein kinase